MTSSENVIKKTVNNSYRVLVTPLPSPPGIWNSTEISIYSTGAIGRKLGGYTRNYPAHGLGTWYPFSHGDKDYALYSRHYTATRIMELPSCKDIGGEEPSSGGFCPVEYLVPDIVAFQKEPDSEKPGSFHHRLVKEPSSVAFVAGCIWGDDSSWKIQCFDLSRVAEGIIKRDERFGYVAMPKGVTLADSVSLERDEESGAVIVTLAVLQTYDLATGEYKWVDPFD